MIEKLNDIEKAQLILEITLTAEQWKALAILFRRPWPPYEADRINLIKMITNVGDELLKMKTECRLISERLGKFCFIEPGKKEGV